jgi:hypothetical protein
MDTHADSPFVELADAQAVIGYDQDDQPGHSDWDPS